MKPEIGELAFLIRTWHAVRNLPMPEVTFTYARRGENHDAAAYVAHEFPQSHRDPHELQRLLGDNPGFRLAGIDINLKTKEVRHATK